MRKSLHPARTRIQLVPSAFNPLLDTVASTMQDTTDGEGRFLIADPVPGNYRVEAHQGASGKRALLGTFAHGDTAQSVADIRLQAAGTLRVSLPESLWLAGGYVFIPGTTFKAMIGESHVNTLAPIPAMVVPALAYARDPLSVSRILARDVDVRAGDTALVKLDAKPDPVPKVDSIPRVDSVAAVLGQATLELNTTVAAAGIQADVQGFPLLVRLDSSNFDFSRAPAPGAGIVFTDSIGRALPFEVERWNAGLRKAEIRVRMDVVKGGPPSTWSLIGGTYDGATAMAFSDGAVRVSRAFTPLLGQKGLSALLGAPDLAGLDKYTGAVDEVRIEGTARSTAWIKLCYENQKAGQVLVRRIP